MASTPTLGGETISGAQFGRHGGDVKKEDGEMSDFGRWWPLSHQKFRSARPIVRSYVQYVGSIFR